MRTGLHLSAELGQQLVPTFDSGGDRSTYMDFTDDENEVCITAAAVVTAIVVHVVMSRLLYLYLHVCT